MFSAISNAVSTAILNHWSAELMESLFVSCRMVVDYTWSGLPSQPFKYRINSFFPKLFCRKCSFLLDTGRINPFSPLQTALLVSPTGLSEVKGGDATALFNELLLLLFLLWCPINIKFLFSWALSFRKCQPNITQQKLALCLPWLLELTMVPEQGQDEILGHTTWLQNWALSRASLHILGAKPVFWAMPSLALFCHFPKPVVATSIQRFEKSLSTSKALCKYPLLCSAAIHVLK